MYTSHTQVKQLFGDAEMNNCECCGKSASESELRVVVVNQETDQLGWGCKECQKTHETL